jgi:hypothetical protein
MTGKGLAHAAVLETLRDQYQRLHNISRENIVLWFDACLFDQSMLAHILMCLQHLKAQKVELLCIDHFPGIDPYHGIGQLTPAQLASLYGKRNPVTDEQYAFAVEVDEAFSLQDRSALHKLSVRDHAPLSWVPAAVRRWLEEEPDEDTGLGRLETLALEAIKAGCDTPGTIFAYVSKADTPPQYWGDIMLWAKINHLAEREPSLVTITGPAERPPQWETELNLQDFCIVPVR